MKIKSLIKHNLMRAAMTLALIMTCAAAWAETVETYYIDENGTRHDVTATVVTTYMDNLGTDDETTWYVVNENVFLYDGSNNQTCLHGNVNLIIADGCELKPACGSNGPNDGFRGSGNLTLYGQTAGTGTLSCGQVGFMNITGDFTVCSGMVSVSGGDHNAIRAANFTMRGGSVSITNNTNNDCGIRATGTVNIYSGSVVAAGSIGIAAGTINIYGGSVTARCNGRNAPESNYGYAIKCSSTFNFYGGNVTVQGDYNWHEGQTRYGIHANSINLSWTSTDDWIYNTKDGNSDNVICYFAGSDVMTIAPYKPFTDGTTTYTGTLTDEQVEALADKTLQPAVPAFANSGDGTPEHPYTIYNATGWGEFCDALQDATYNHFSGQTVKLGANISVTQSAGSAGHEFMGTFDGDGKTLTVDITETTTQGTAPFREINGATIQNLVVTGSVEGTTHAAGLVGFARGADASTVNTITNCKVATNVTVTTPNSAGNYHCGGVVGHAFHCTLNMSNTVYCGVITNSGHYVGGLQGWSDGNTINFSHCLFAGSYSGTASFHPVAVRSNNSATTANVSHVYYTATPTLTNSNYIAADGTKATGRTTAPDNLGSQGATYSFMGMTLYENGLFYNGLYYVAPTLNTDNSGAYLISSVDDWTNFCDMLYDNGTYNRFSGQTVKLGADIEVSRMAGANSHDFCGTFDGQNNTLTFNHTAADNYCAPFRYVQGTGETNHAVIQNLNVVTNITAEDFRHTAGLIALQSGYVDVTDCNAVVNINCTKGTNNPNDLYPAGLVSQSNNTGSLTVSGCTVSGTISTDGKYAAGMVGIVQGSANITNSVSSVTINSSTDGDGTHGGFVASLPSGRQLTIEGCVFNGKIVTTNGMTTNCGGFLGHNNTVNSTGATITNCLYAPAADSNTVSTDCATFGRNVNSDLISNCYYTTALGDAQGTQAYSISGGDYVTVGNAGTVSNNYTTSGLTFYNVGLKYGDVLYAASNDEVSLTLGCTLPEGYVFNGYTVSPTEASLTGNDNDGYTLTMPNGNVTINATLTPIISYIDENGETQQCTEFTLLTGNETTLGTSGQETWYVADDTLNYGQTITISGNVHLILKDNAVMNVGTEETPINGHGISCDNSSISIYAQSMGESQGQLHLNTNGDSSNYHNGILAQNNGSITINGGEVEAIGAIGIYAENSSVNINSGKVTAFGSNGWGIIVENDNVTINGGQMSANNIFALDGSITINGGQVTANDINANANGSSVTINGGQVTANSIVVYEGNITLGWSNASDFIFASSYNVIEYGTLSIAEGKAFITEDGNTYSSGTVNASYINGKTLYPYIVGSVVYLDENGQRQLCTQYTIFEGGETPLGTGWYVADGTHNYVQTITINGDVHLILKDNAVMNVGLEEDPISGHGIHVDGSSFNSSFSIYAQSTGESQGQLNVIAGADPNSDYNGIYAEGSSITINGGKVTVNGIYYSDIYIDNGSVTINGGQVYADIYSNNNASVTINGGQVTADNIDAPSGVTINGGQVTANYGGINAINGNITLGWSNASDFIFASSYSVIEYGTLSIAEGKTFIDEDGNTFESGTIDASAIDGKTLYPYIEGSIPYIDENGQRQLCIEYNVLNGTETSLGTSGQETWYVADGMLDYSQTINLNGDVHLILKDNTVMNVGTEETPINGHGIDGRGLSISIYAQSMGESQGQLHLNTDAYSSAQYSGILALNSGITINGGKVSATGYSGIFGVNAPININGGQVTVDGSGWGIYGGDNNININGGQVTANGGRYGIQAYGGNITLGWTNVTDFIYANSYDNSYYSTDITLSKAFIDEAGQTYSGNIAKESDGAYAINGKWLYPNTVSLFTKTIAAHHTEEGVNYGWYLIASPLSGGTNAEAVAHLVNSETPANFDLYRFNQAAELEWENWKQQNSDHYHFNLEPGRGYLYANAADVNLVFAGTPYSGNGEVTITNVAGHPLSGWNLVGNPFSVDAYIGRDFYVLNEARSEVMPEASTGAIPPMEGVFVLAEQDEETVTFSTEALNKGRASKPEQVVLNLSRDRGLVIDRTIVRMGEGRTLPKFQLNRNSTKLYIPQDGTDYAIACAESTGEMPLNFKASENGTYTLTISTTLNSQHSTLNYLHLIDNMTGADVDLLTPPAFGHPLSEGEAQSGAKLGANSPATDSQTPAGFPLCKGGQGDSKSASYTFTAKTTDYESRFRLVFSICEDANGANEAFAFISNGNIIVNGEGTLQIFDILGHQLFTKQLSTLNSKLSTLNYKSGVYVLRLIDGDTIRTQKIVIE